MNHDETQRSSSEPVAIGGALHEVEDQVRLALDTDARSIQPTERLDAILASARSGEPLRFLDEPRRGRPWLVAGAAAAAAAVVVGTVWVAGRPDTPTPALTTSTSTSSPASTPPTGPSSTTGSPQPLPTTTTSSTEGPVAVLRDVPVYWVGETGGKPKLFREFRTVPDRGGLVLSALYAMTRERPLDADYSTPWSPASQITLTTSGGNLTVNLDRDAVQGTAEGRTPALARLAVQQLVYTATAAAAKAGTPVSTVTIHVAGTSTDLWGTDVSLGTPTARAAALDVQSQVWILSPGEGQHVAAGRVDITAYGTSFEATFHAVLRASATGKVVDDRPVMGGSNGEFREFAFSYTLQPGTYVLQLSTDDPSGGAEGNGPDVDTKTFVVD